MRLHCAIWPFCVLAVVASASDNDVAPDRKQPAPATARTIPDRAALELRFRETLNEAELRGMWQMADEKGLKGESPLSDPQAEKYTIAKVTKVAGDRWLVMARIEYGEKDLTVPVPVRVVWAEDTPIITLDEVDIPGFGKYSARVMIYRNFYSGTWFGDCYGGILSGQIVKAAPKEKPADTEGQGK